MAVMMMQSICLLLLIGPPLSTASEQQQQLRQSSATSNQQQQNKLINNNNNIINRIDWSNLGATNLTSELPELSTDWLMLGGSSANDPSSRSNNVQPNELELMISNEAKSSVSFADKDTTKTTNKKNRNNKQGKRNNAKNKSRSSNSTSVSSSVANIGQQFDEEQITDESESSEIFDDVEEVKLAGTSKEPECASLGRYYCTYKEDYPTKLVTEVTKYYKWPLEKLFRDLHAQIMPKLAQDSNGNLVCDSITRVVRPGWARNTNDRWLVVINTENYHQYVTEVVCQYGSNSRCNFIPPCYYSSCQQRYNTQKLLVIDPTNPYRGPFLSEFLFPSCCVCYVPKTSEALNDKYRASPASIYQRTMQQDSSMNLNPMQAYNLVDVNAPGSGSGSGSSQPGAEADAQASGFADPNRMQPQQTINPNNKLQQQSSSSQTNLPSIVGMGTNQPLGPGEIRRSGELMPQKMSNNNKNNNNNNNKNNNNNYQSALASRAKSSFPNFSMDSSSNVAPNENDESARSSRS